MRFAGAVVLALALLMPAAAKADDFQQWLQAAWPDAQKLGVSRGVFEAATRGLEPDYSLPDLQIPGRTEKPPPQPEFVRTPEQYVRESYIARLAATGRKLAARYRDTLARIDKRFGVPGPVVLAIWGRETDYGRETDRHDAIRALATEGFVGRRKDYFRNEFLLALKMLQDGIPRSDMRSSWSGALGLTQFLPSDYYKFAVNFDGKGRPDIWHSVPDALASAAKQLTDRGWVAGEPWAIEVHVPANVDCTLAVPSHQEPIGAWLARGFKPAYGRKLSARVRAIPASLLLPEGTYGPAFLAPKNFFVIKEYNFSDLYVLFVGHLADRIAGAKPFEQPWSKDKQLKTRQVEAMQERLAALGLYRDKIDGKAGMHTRAALGEYQKKNGLKVDCWPTRALLDQMESK